MEPITHKQLKAFLTTHKAIKKKIFCEECSTKILNLSRWQLERILKGETSIDKHEENIVKVMIKYGFKYE